MLDGMLASIKIPELQQLLQELREGNTLQEVLHGIVELKNKFERQEQKFDKLVVLISKMYQDGELNKDTFNKFDQFLKEYYDNPYVDSNS